MNQTSPEYDLLARTIIIGESNVGKTSIWERYCDNTFLDYYRCTVGIAFKIKTIEVSGKKVKLQIWDTAGQERFKSLAPYQYKGARGIIFCYAIDNRESFEKVAYWMQEVEKYKTEENICFIIVGTKSDLSNQRVVSIDEGRQFADYHEMKFFETSSKENLNIDEAFLSLAKDMCEVFGRKEGETQQSGPQLSQKENDSQTQITCSKCS